jgi:putative addiction module component (TIGR02574 family)
MTTNHWSEFMNAEYTRLLELGVSEKLELVEALWDSIALSPEELPVPSWQQDELAKRKAAHLRNPDAAISWEEAKERIRQRHG